MASLLGAVRPGDNPLYHPVSPVPAVTIPGMAGDQALGAELVLWSGGQPSPDAAIAAEPLGPGAGPSGRCSMTSNPRRCARACALRGLIGRIGLLSLLGGKR
jgi:hypothetical protein